MDQLLVLKERIIRTYQKVNIIVEPVIRFILAYVVFSVINGQIGFNTRFANPGVSLLLSLLCAFTPSFVLVLLAAVLSVIHIYSASMVLAIFVGIIFLILYLLFVRFVPKYGYAVLAIPILYPMNLAYFVPLFLGMTANPASMLAVICGVLIYFMIEVVKVAAQMSVNNSVEDILALFKYVIDSLLDNKSMLLVMIIFALVVLVTYFLRRMKFDHAFGISILSGTVVMLLGFIFGNLKLSFSDSIWKMILGCLASGMLVGIIQFFKLTLDYTAVERTQFEDDDYYYYVKAVPKIKIAVPEKNVKTIQATEKFPKVEAATEKIPVQSVKNAVKSQNSTVKPEKAFEVEEFDFEELQSFADDMNEFEPIKIQPDRQRGSSSRTSRKSRNS